MLNLLRILLAAIQYILVSGQTSPYNSVDLNLCSPAPTSMANPPSLSELDGIWYMYITDFGPYGAILDCGICEVRQETTDVTVFRLQCIVSVNELIGSMMVHHRKFITGTLTQNVNQITFAGGTVTAPFVVSNFNLVTLSLAVTLCIEYTLPTFVLPPGQTNPVRLPIEIGLVRAGPVTGLTDVTSAVTGQLEPIETTACYSTPFEFTRLTTSPGIVTDGFFPNTVRAFPTRPSCAALGYTLVGTTPRQRYLRLFTTLRTWDAAKTACENLGSGFLLAIADSATILTTIQTSPAFLGTGGAATIAWIGLRKIARVNTAGTNSEFTTLQWANTAETRFQMIDDTDGVNPAGTFVQFGADGNNEWDEGDTALNGNDCYSLNTADGANFGWGQEACGTSRAYICECLC